MEERSPTHSVSLLPFSIGRIRYHSRNCFLASIFFITVMHKILMNWVHLTFEIIKLLTKCRTNVYVNNAWISANSECMCRQTSRTHGDACESMWMKYAECVIHRCSAAQTRKHWTGEHSLFSISDVISLFWIFESYLVMFWSWNINGR